MDNMGKGALRLRWFSRAAVLVVAAVAMHFTAAEAAAQRFKAGDEVEVLMHNRWQSGTVVSTGQGGMVVVEFGTLTRRQQRPFKRTEVRLAYEADALSPARSWSDASGNFKITAVLLSVGTDEVTLRKPDMSELKVPIAKLSESDQQYIKRLEKSEGGSTGGIPKPPPLEQFEGGGIANTSAARGLGGRPELTSSQPLSFDGDGPANALALTPDPVPAYLKVKQGGVAFSLNLYAIEDLGALITVGGRDHWVLAAVENQGGLNKQPPTRLLWVSLARQKVERELFLPHGEMVIDYHPPSRRLLTYTNVDPSEAPGHRWKREALTVWEVLPTDNQVKPIVRWDVTRDNAPMLPGWGRILDSRYVAYRNFDRHIVVWDTVGKRVHYRLEQDYYSTAVPVLSGARKYLFLPENRKVQIFDAVSGKVLRTLPCNARVSRLAMSNDGTRLAVLDGSTLAIWDLTDTQSEPRRYQADAVANGPASELLWMDDEHLLVNEADTLRIFSLKHEIIVWSYLVNTGWIGDHARSPLRELCDGHLVYAAEVGVGKQGVAVGAVALPGPKVTEATADVDPETLIAIKPGVSIRLEVSAGEHAEQIRKTLEERITAHGWKIDPAAEIAVVASIKRGKPQEVFYGDRQELASLLSGGPPSLFGRRQPEQPKRPLEKAIVEPYISTLKIVVNDKDAWSQSKWSGIPRIIEEGLSVQAEVDKWQKPDPGFFKTVVLPERVMDPQWKHGLGITKVTNRGLVVE